MQTDIQVALISGGIALVASIVTAWLTTKHEYRKQLKQHLYEERERTYIEIFNILQELRDHPYYIFNCEKIVTPLKAIRTAVSFYGSADLIDELERCYTRIYSEFKKYVELFDEDYEIQRSIRAEINGETEMDFEREIEQYQDNHILSATDIADMQKRIITIMRKDLNLNK